MRPPGRRGVRSASDQPLRRLDPSADERRLTSSGRRASSPQYNGVNAAIRVLKKTRNRTYLDFLIPSIASCCYWARAWRPAKGNEPARRLAAILAADVAGYSRLIGTASMATIRHGQIPNGHRWDSLPNVRLATDSAREGGGFANSWSPHSKSIATGRRSGEQPRRPSVIICTNHRVSGSRGRNIGGTQDRHR
jgi:hypothetical protein